MPEVSAAGAESGGGVRAERIYATEEKAGAQKKQIVMDEIGNALPLVQAEAALAGHDLQLPPEILQEISAATDEQVALMNRWSKILGMIQAKPAPAG